MMNELLKTNSKLELHIYGDGGEKNNIVNKINELGLTNNIYLNGYVEDISKVYNEAVFSLLTSRCEGFSLAVLESLSHGVPAASYDIPYGPSSMIKNSENGILVEHGEYKLMAQKISQIIGSPEKLKNMSENAYNSVDRYKEIEVAKIWESILMD